LPHVLVGHAPIGSKPRPFNPATDLPALEDKTKTIGNVALLILDPVVAAIPMSRNSHNNAEARNGMQPVVDYARATSAAVVGIGHLTKGTAGKDPLERINGSGAFGALPRLVMGAAKNDNGRWWFYPNSLNKFTVSMRDKPQFNADGSLTLCFQNESPGKHKEANWLPAPKDEFILCLRMYWPTGHAPSILPPGHTGGFEGDRGGCAVRPAPQIQCTHFDQ
jgi:hypothetical protein